jgi:integrase
VTVSKKAPRGRIRPAKETDWPDAVNRFMAHLENADRSHHTTQAYRENLSAFAKWWAQTSADPLTPGAISDDDVRDWRNFLRQPLEKAGRKRKPATINAMMSALKSFLGWAAGPGKIIETRPSSPPRERLARRTVKWLDRKQQNALLRTASKARTPRERALVVILIETGVRVAELVALERSDVEMSEKKGTLEVRAGKGCKPRRVMLSRDAREAFQRLRALDSDAPEDEPIFHSQRKDHTGRRKRLSVRGVESMFKRLARKLGWSELHPHQLRHTCAINLRDAGWDWTLIAAHLGHSSVKTTMDHYGVPSERDLRRAVDPDGDDD